MKPQLWICSLILVMWVGPSIAAFSCSSSFRDLFPALFGHCQSCSYSSPYKTETGVYRYASRCSAKSEMQVRSTRFASGANCRNQVSLTYECEPELHKKARDFITTLRLGANAPTTNPNGPPAPTASSFNYAFKTLSIANGHGGQPQTCSGTGRKRSLLCGGAVKCPNTELRQQNNRICSNMCPTRGKRASKVLRDSNGAGKLNSSQHTLTEQERSKRSCSTRHVLFVVDTSGSISESHFTKVKELLAGISSKLCNYLKLAMITFNHDINLEFCFDCYTSRSDIAAAIRRTKYRGGLTYTTNAVKCACEKVLQSSCGLPSGLYTPNIDVVVLTDGYHNGPCKSNFHSQLQCLHGRSNINTFGIGIGNHLQSELTTITKSKGENIFAVSDFNALEELFTLMTELLNLKVNTNGVTKNLYDCAGHSGNCHGK